MFPGQRVLGAHRRAHSRAHRRAHPDGSSHVRAHDGAPHRRSDGAPHRRADDAPPHRRADDGAPGELLRTAQLSGVLRRRPHVPLVRARQRLSREGQHERMPGGQDMCARSLVPAALAPSHRRGPLVLRADVLPLVLRGRRDVSLVRREGRRGRVPHERQHRRMCGRDVVRRLRRPGDVRSVYRRRQDVSLVRTRQRLSHRRERARVSVRGQLSGEQEMYAGGAGAYFQALYAPQLRRRVRHSTVRHHGAAVQHGLHLPRGQHARCLQRPRPLATGGARGGRPDLLLRRRPRPGAHGRRRRRRRGSVRAPPRGRSERHADEPAGGMGRPRDCRWRGRPSICSDRGAGRGRTDSTLFCPRGPATRRIFCPRGPATERISRAGPLPRTAPRKTTANPKPLPATIPSSRPTRCRCWARRVPSRSSSRPPAVTA
mmetsp:Transcript_39361/g.76848  ORF Transcript_39361/g.76848 Transcript_39361/m.76848 type:complete len:430 (-) Transcript_39361:778-2067(-)